MNDKRSAVAGCVDTDSARGVPPLDSCKFVCLKDLLVDKVGKIL